jgi:hypothetical protein
MPAQQRSFPLVVILARASFALKFNPFVGAIKKSLLGVFLDLGPARLL